MIKFLVFLIFIEIFISLFVIFFLVWIFVGMDVCVINVGIEIKFFIVFKFLVNV